MKYDANFDNVGYAMITMFCLMTTEGWNGIMWAGVDATEIHQAPRLNMSPAISLFFIGFLIIGSLFILNLFVAVVIETFYSEKEKLSKTNELTMLQQEYCDIMKKCYKAYPVKEY